MTLKSRWWGLEIVCNGITIERTYHHTVLFNNSPLKWGSYLSLWLRGF